jgi:uncharacterized membrane protein YhiD involved in acid resistance
MCLGVCIACLLGMLLWNKLIPAAGEGWEGLLAKPAPAVRAGTVTAHPPLVELLKLISAFLIGGLITGVHRLGRPAGLHHPSMDQAQVLLCVSGAMMMILIADSLARAFGIAGAASIIRFRTPVEDPKEAIILFLSLGLGMACGLGAFALAGLATAFLCVVLLLQNRLQRSAPRAMILSVASEGPGDPAAHVQEVLATNGVDYEPREYSHGDRVEVKYQVMLEENKDLDVLSRALRNGGSSGIREVSWEKSKKKDR